MSVPDDRQLDTLIERTRPEASGSGDWEDVVARSRRGGRLAQVAGRAVGIAAAAAIAGVLVVLVLAAPRGKDAPTVPAAGEVVVPDLTGLDIEEARTRVRAAGIDIGVVTARPESAPVASVLTQTPAAGHVLASDRYVTVEIASPPGPRPRVPNLTLKMYGSTGADSVVAAGSLRLRDPQLRVRALIFTASWCEPCRPFNRGVRLSAGGAGRTDPLIYVAVADRPRNLRETNGILAADSDGQIAQRLGATGVPTVVFIDRRGRIAARLLGAPRRPRRTISNLLTALQAEPVGDDPRAQPLTFDSAFFDSTPLSRNEVPSLLASSESCLIDPDDVRRVDLGAAGLYVSRGYFGVLVESWARKGKLDGFGCANWSPDASRPGPVNPGVLTLQGTSTIRAAIVQRGYTEALVGERWVPVRDDGLLILRRREAGALTKLRGPRGTLTLPYRVR